MSQVKQSFSYLRPGIYTINVPDGFAALDVSLWGGGGAKGTAGATGQVITSRATVSTQLQASVAGGSQQFTANGTWTVPAGVRTISAIVAGGGGGGGGADGDASGGYSSGGYPGDKVTATISVTPGQQFNIVIGGAGAGGAGRATSGAGGAGGVGFSVGGKGGNSGGEGSSGAGGGGGGASALLIGTTPVIVAGGGGGAGGSGNGNWGRASINRYGATANGAAGGNKSGDGGGGGGGGGGYPLGGAGGTTVSGDAGAWSGMTGQSLVPSGGTLSTAGNGGGYISGRGGAGSISISWGAVSAEIVTATKETTANVTGGQGGLGAGGGFAKKKIRVAAGDVITVAVGNHGVAHLGGTSLITPINYSGGSAGSSLDGGQGGGGGGATVILINGIVVAVAAGGAGGGGGGAGTPKSKGVNGTDGTSASNSGVGAQTQGLGRSSPDGIATGGGGGGGFYGGMSGQGGVTATGGQGGVNYGDIILEGTGQNPGGFESTYLYPGNNVGKAGYSGAVLLNFIKSFNITIKSKNKWNTVNDAWVKVNNTWSEIANGWTKVNGKWQPLISPDTSVNLSSATTPIQTYVLSSSADSIAEGTTVTFTLSTSGIDVGTKVPYTVVGVAASDLIGDQTKGTFVVGSKNEVMFNVVANKTTNGDRTLRISIDNSTAAAICNIIDSSKTPIYGVTASNTQINEGGTVRFTMTDIFGVTGDLVPYVITGIAANRITRGSLTGNFVVGGLNYVDITVGANSQIDGITVMTIKLTSSGSTASCTVFDSSQPPIYGLTANNTQINEGGTVRFTLSSKYTAVGDIVPYVITGIAENRITSGELTGIFVIGSKNYIDITMAENVRTDSATDVITIKLPADGTTASCKVIDSSKTIYKVTASVPQINEGGTVTFTLSTIGGQVGEVVPYIASGINVADLSAGALRGNFVVGKTDTISFTLANDLLTEGLETLTISLYTDLGNAVEACVCKIVDTSESIPSGTKIFTASGKFVVPARVNSIFVAVIGGGGGGGAGGPSGYSAGGGGGGGGNIYTATIPTKSGTEYVITIGAGGVGGTASGSGKASDGGVTSISGIASVAGGIGANNVVGYDGYWGPGSAGGAGNTTGGTGAGGSSNRTPSSAAAGQTSTYGGVGGAAGNGTLKSNGGGGGGGYGPTKLSGNGTVGNYGGSGGIGSGGNGYGAGGGGGGGPYGTGGAGATGAVIISWG